MKDLYRHPIKGAPISSPFGMRQDPFNPRKRQMHYGTDYAAPLGTPVHSIRGGTVISRGYNPMFGNFVILKHHRGITALYGHLQQKSRLKVGQRLTIPYRTVGYVGNTGNSTGPHLYLRIEKYGTPIDPEVFLSHH